MASNDDFELTEKYNDNDWAAFIHSNRFTDKLKEKTEKIAASHGSAIHLQDSSGTHEKIFERMDPMSNEYSSTKLSIDDVHLYGHTPLIDDLYLVMCLDCRKSTKIQNLLSHIKDHDQSVEEYEKKINLSKEHSTFFASERLNMCSNKRKKEPQIVLDGLSEEKSKDVESQLNSFLSHNSPVSQLPIESENSVAHSSSYTEKKRKKGLHQSKSSKYNKRKTKVGYQSQENVPNLSNSVYSEQSTSSVNRTESVLFSYQASPDSNHSVISGHSTALPGSTIYSTNHLKSIKQSSVLDFQSNDRGKDSFQRNYFSSSLLSAAPVLNKSTECSEQQSCTNSFETNDVMRTPSNQSFLQMSAKSLFPSTNEQDTEDHFLSIGNKQPVKSPPRPRLETSISNNNKYESENSEPFLVVNKESSALSICSSSNSPAGDSLSKLIPIEDEAKNKVPIIHSPAVYCARLMSINRIVQSPYVSVFRSDRSYRLKQALSKSIAEENAQIREMKFKVASDISRCGAESGYFSTSPKSASASEPSPIPELQLSTNFVSHPSPSFSLPPSPNSAQSEYHNSSVQQSVNSASEIFQNSTSQSSPNYASEQSSSPPSSSVSQPFQNSLTRSPSIVCLILDRKGERQRSRTTSDLTKEMKLFKNYNVDGKPDANSEFVDFSTVTTNYLSKEYVNLVNQTNNSGVKGTHRKYSNGCNNVFFNRKNCENNINKTNKCGVKKKQHV